MKTYHLDTNKKESLGIVVVTYDYEATVDKLLSTLINEKRSGDKIIVWDNHPSHRCASLAEQMDMIDYVVRSSNIGFAAGCNEAVKKLKKQVDLILFINPDCLPKPSAVSKMRKNRNKAWAACMGIVLLPDGTVNTTGNIVHVSGLSWVGNYGLKPNNIENSSFSSLSGACLMIKSSVWYSIGGFCEDYFMYYEDTDLSLTLLEQGYSLGVVKDAYFEHSYSFLKGNKKWFYLERNRYYLIIRNWPVFVLLTLIPLLFFVEIGLWIISIKEKRFKTRFRAVASLFLNLPLIIKGRFRKRRNNKLSDLEFFRILSPTITTALVPYVNQNGTINKLLKHYYSYCYKFIKLKELISRY